MTNAPWEADRELGLDQVRGAISSQFPELGPPVVELLGSGWDHDAFLVNGTWVFRFPRRQEVIAGLKRGIRMMPTVADILSGTRLSVPIFEKVGRPGPFFPYEFAGYRWLSGVAADQIPPEILDTKDLARTLGGVFSRLHAVTPSRVAHLGVPRETDGPTEWLQELVKNAGRVWPVLPPTLAEECEPWLAGTVVAPELYRGPAGLIHNDICPDHLLVDPESGCLTGIIDFEDLSFGDPVSDVVALYCWLGRDFAADAIDAYELPIDFGFRDRLEFLARILSLVWLGEASERGGDEQIRKHLVWVCRSFGLALSELDGVDGIE